MAVAGGGRILLLVFVAVMEIVYPGLCQTHNRGAFQVYKSCDSSGSVGSLTPSIRITRLVVNDEMWLQGKEAVTLISTRNTNKSCVLPPNTTHQITVGVHLQIHVEGAAEEEERECSFPRDTTFQLSGGLLKVSCILEKSRAEAEMLGAEESSSNAPSTARPRHRSLDLVSPEGTTQGTATTLGPQGSHATLTTLTTLESLMRVGSHVSLSSASVQPQTTPGVRRTGSSGDENFKTIVMVTETTSSTTSPPLTDDMVVKTTEVQDSASDHVTEGGMAETTDGITLATPDGSITQKSNITKGNISVLGQPKNPPPNDPGDQIIYLAGAGAGVLALVLGVVVVVSVVHYRRRQAKTKEVQEDLFITGAYRGSMQDLTHSGSHGAYLNAHVMYSGADPEFVESFEMEERILSTSVSYSSHDIPKCLKEG